MTVYLVALYANLCLVIISFADFGLETESRKSLYLFWFGDLDLLHFFITCYLLITILSTSGYKKDLDFVGRDYCITFLECFGSNVAWVVIVLRLDLLNVWRKGVTLNFFFFIFYTGFSSLVFTILLDNTLSKVGCRLS